MNTSRRKFLATLAGGSAVLSLSGPVPKFLAQAAAAESTGSKDTILVVVQLTGGNDGLNTVVPFNHDAYRKARPKLAIPAKDVLKINDVARAASVGAGTVEFVGSREACHRPRRRLSQSEPVPL